MTLRRHDSCQENLVGRIAPFGDLRRANKLGVHFRRQQVIQGFIVDFYCHKAGLVIEVDGDIHDLQKEEDERWEKVLNEMGLRIVRFGNDEVVKSLSAVVEKIKSCIIGTGDFTYDKSRTP